MDERVETIVELKVRAESLTIKLEKLTAERDALLRQEDINAQTRKVEIAQNYQAQIGELQVQKEQAITDHKALLEAYALE